MGQVLHRSATTTEAVRRAIQHSQESMRPIAVGEGMNRDEAMMKPDFDFIEGVSLVIQPIANISK